MKYFIWDHIIFQWDYIQNQSDKDFVRSIKDVEAVTISLSTEQCLLLFLLTFRICSSNQPVQERIPLPGVYQASYTKKKENVFHYFCMSRNLRSKFKFVKIMLLVPKPRLQSCCASFMNINTPNFSIPSSLSTPEQNTCSFEHSDLFCQDNKHKTTYVILKAMPKRF